MLDPLSLSIAIKQIGVLSADQQGNLSQKLPEVAHKLSLLSDVRKRLTEHVTNRFQDCYSRRDLQGLVACIQVLFNQEILSDQVQNRVNQTLRSLHTNIKTQLAALQTSVNGSQPANEEFQLVDKAIGSITHDLAQQTNCTY